MRDNSEIFLRMKNLDIVNSRIDMHMHTTWTDGKDSLNDMARQAEINSLTSIAITDHIRKESDYYLHYLKDIKNIFGNFNVKIYSGFEAKIVNLKGDIDIPDEAVEKSDFVIASVHRLPYGQSYRHPKEIPFAELALLEKDLTLTAIKNNKRVSVVGHCGGMSIAAYGEFPVEYFEEIIRACVNNEIAFEYNYKYHNGYEKKLKELLIRYNPYVSIGSDAHERNRVSNRSFCDGED